MTCPSKSARILAGAGASVGAAAAARDLSMAESVPVLSLVPEPAPVLAGTARAVLFASFGTTYQAARESCIDAVADDLARAFPDRTPAQAYTSVVVRRVLAERGVRVDDVPGALRSMSTAGVRDVLVQPGHLFPGEEYDRLCAQVRECLPLFDRVSMGAPLLSGSDDLERLTGILCEAYPRQDGRAVVLVGHGSYNFSNVVYAALSYHLHLRGRDDLVVGTVEGFPGPDEVLRLLGRVGAKRVLLVPLLLVAGEHATKDMAGEDPESWASRLRAAGYEVACHMGGLGELPAVRALYVEHARNACELGPDVADAVHPSRASGVASGHGRDEGAR